MDELIKIALVGTAKFPGMPTRDGDGIDDLFSELSPLPDQSPENLLLLRAGAAAAYEQAGLAPSRVSDSSPPAQPVPAPADPGPRCSRRLIGLLQNAFASDNKELLREFARWMKTSGLLIPPEVLPAALNIQESDLREVLLPILGNRGRWLSQFNSAWQWVLAGVGILGEVDQSLLIQQWTEGNIAQRCFVLRRLREADPAEARRLVGEVFKVEKPEHRSRLLEQFAANLSADDEPFLEDSLSDRSEIVRSTAAHLLARLPGSQLTLRMTARADQLLVAAAGSKAGKLRLECKPPTEIDATWKRDGVSDRTAAGRGKRAEWVIAVLRAVSPSHWTDRFETSPASLIVAVQDDDYASAVIEGWTAAALTFADQAASLPWLAPLWYDWSKCAMATKGNSANVAAERLDRLLRALPADQAEACLTNLMSAGDAAEALIPSLIGAAPRPWSVAFSRAYLKSVVARMNKNDNSSYRWVCTLPDAAKAIGPDCFAEAVSTIEAAVDSSQNARYASREIDKFVEIVRMRQTFFEEIRV